MPIPSDGGVLRLALLCAACWLAAIAGGRRQDAGPVVTGLALGGLLAHAGWCALHPTLLWQRPAWLLDWGAGQSLLFVPLGPLLASVLLRDRARRGAFRAAMLRALPLALATARLGCLAAGCCVGRTLVELDASPVGLPPATPGRHPVALYEIAGWLALRGLLARMPDARVVPGFAMAFGGLRLLVEPLRAAPVLAPDWPAWWVAAAWLVAGVRAGRRAGAVSRRTGRGRRPSAPRALRASARAGAGAPPRPPPARAS